VSVIVIIKAAGDRRMLRNRGAAIALVVLFLLGSYAAWISSQPSQTPERQTTSYEAKRQPNQGNPAEALGDFFFHDGITTFTFFLAVFTGILGLVAIVEIRYLRRAETKSDELADITQKQMLISGRQTDIIEKQHAVGRMQFISTHRPRLKVRYFRIINTSKEQAIIRFTIVNVGGSDAKLIGSLGLAKFFAVGIPPAPVYLGGKELVEPRRFKAGATDEGAIVFDIPTETSIGEMASAHRALYVYGYLVYEDALENTRTTAFCRRYDTALDRFSPVKDPDYEYED
jgi:hypothetical protein